jgi:hypothetical protein
VYLTYCELECHNRASKSHPYSRLITGLRSKAIPSIHTASFLLRAHVPCAAIAVARISFSASGDRGTIVHLKGCGALSDPNLISPYRKQQHMTYVEAPEVIAFGSILISTPFSSFALEMLKVDSIDAIIILLNGLSWGYVFDGVVVAYEISRQIFSGTDPT